MEKRIKRLLLLLDGSKLSWQILRFGQWLARIFSAEVKPVYIEEPSLLPQKIYAREVRFFSFQVQREDFFWQKEVRFKEERVRKFLGQGEVSDLHLAKVQGNGEEVLLNQVTSGDLVILGKRGWSKRGFFCVGSTATQLLKKGCGSVLLLEEGEKPINHYLVILEGCEHDRQVLDFSFKVYNSYPKDIFFFIPAEKKNFLSSLSIEYSFLKDKDIFEFKNKSELFFALSKVRGNNFLFLNFLAEEELFNFICNFKGSVFALR